MATSHLHMPSTHDFVEHMRDPLYEAFFLLRTLFTVAPILFGLDKFFNILPHVPGGHGSGQWDKYLANWLDVLGDPVHTMYLVGVIEITAGLLVAFAPRIGAWVVAAWLGGIIVDLLTLSGYYDVALRDFGLLVAAVTLGVLARAMHDRHMHDRPVT